MEREQNANIKVICRVRPFNQKEEEDKKMAVEIEQQKMVQKQFHNVTPNQGFFSFDHVFNINATQIQIYQKCKIIIFDIFEGINSTIFAYGQTSSGKTYTMQGFDINDYQKKGIIPRLVQDIFTKIEQTPMHIQFRLKVSLVQIYMEKIRDLLDSTKTDLKIRENKTRGIFIQDYKEVFNLINLANNSRAISATNMNNYSSRSHMLFILTIFQNNLQDLSAKSAKLILVDLAGSQKISKTGAQGKTLQEAKQINRSLSALGNVINALTQPKVTHIPYRDSKLTRILQQSLGGNSKTFLIITCSPSILNEHQTLSTLRFGFRAKNIKNKPKINREYTVQQLTILLQKAQAKIKQQANIILNLQKIIKSQGKQHMFDNKRIIQEQQQKLQKDNQKLQSLRQIKEQQEQFLEFKKQYIEKTNADEQYTNQLQQQRSSMNYLKDTINKLEQEIKLQKRNYSLQIQKCNLLKDQLDLQKQKNQQLTNKYQEIIKKMNQTQQTILEQQKKFVQIKKQLQISNHKNHSLEIEIVQIMEKNTIFKDQIKFLNQFKKQIEQQLNQIQKQNQIVSLKQTYCRNKKKENYKLNEINQELQKQLNKTKLILKQKQNTINLLMARYGSQQINQVKKLDDNAHIQNQIERIAKIQSKKDLYDEIKYLIKQNQYLRILRSQKIHYQQQKQYFQNEKLEIFKNLQNRIIKVVQLEQKLDETKDKISYLEKLINNDNNTNVKKILKLQNNLKELQQRYYAVKAQQSSWKVDNRNQQYYLIIRKKLQRKQQRILQLENKNVALKQQIYILKKKYQEINEKYDKLKVVKEINKQLPQEINLQQNYRQNRKTQNKIIKVVSSAKLFNMNKF